MELVWLWSFLIVIKIRRYNMLETNNNIIIVDDNEQHLNYLANVFCHYGIGCRTFLYDEFNIIQEPLENVKLAFFDITLTDAGDENAQMAVLRDALKSYISLKNKAFALVFWTSNPEYKEQFVEFVNRSDDRNEVPKPVLIETIDKNEFLEHDEEIHNRLSDLMDEKLIKCLFSFDSELKQASEKSLNEVLKLIDFPNEWGKNEQYVKNIKEVFAIIAKETFGDKRGREEPDLAIKEAFGSLFIHHLYNSESTVWSDFMSKTFINNVHEFPNPSIAPNLNTVFHLDLSPKENDARGSVRRIVRTDRNIDELFKCQVGYSINDWIDDVFLKGNSYNGEIKELVAVEISAACDYSNKKKRTHRYLLGIIVPVSIGNKFVNPQKDEEDWHPLGDAFFDLPFSFIYENEECYLFLHLNFLVTEEENSQQKMLGDSLFSLKNEVMNLVGDKHARHIARIGINSFK